MSDITFLAKTSFRKKDQIFGIRKADRRQHIYVIGKTGVGKTAFLKNMALQDIQKGEGIAVIDPHGEFVEEVLDSIPSNRINDVVYFNPADQDYPVSFNILEVAEPEYKHLVASGLIGIFTKIWANVWSARMEYILSNCILALLDTPGTTLLGIMRILVDKVYRQQIINNLKDPVVKSFWINEYEEWTPAYRNEAIAPIQNKVGQFLNVSLIRNIVGQSKSTIDIPEIMDSGKILLVNVSKGRVGEDNSAILGAMVITKIQLATMERVRIPEEKRRDFYLYVDEFQNFATDAFVNILSEARKYHLNLIVAHQYIGQLVAQSEAGAKTAVRDAVFGNVGTIVSFRVGTADAEFLEQEFYPEFTQKDLVNLPNYNIYLKLMINGVTSRPFSARTMPPPKIDLLKSNREKIIRVSRERYSKKREDVEKAISQWSGILERPSEEALFSTTAQPSVLYNTKCTSCGKWTKTVFKTQEGRPVFCKSCLRKMKAAKEAAVPASQGAKLPEVLSQPSDLGALGIEFGPSQSAAPTAPRREKEEGAPPKGVVEVRQPRPLKEGGEISRSEPNFHYPPKKKEKKEIDLTALQKTLSEALGKAKREPEKSNQDE